MNYLLTCLMLTISVHSLHCMQGGEEKDQNKRDFNYIPPDAPKQNSVWVSDNDFPKVLAATPRVCVDVILLRINGADKLEYFMVKRKKKPAKGFWWFPGGGMNPCEEVLDAAERKCSVEGGLVAAAFRTVNFFRTRFPDSEWMHPENGQVLRTDSFNFVVIAFYNPASSETGVYEDAEEVRWVDFDIRPSSLPMPTEEERQGVDVAYLDEAHRQAHEILDPRRENIHSVIEETIRERPQIQRQPYLGPPTTPPEQYQAVDNELIQFSFDEELIAALALDEENNRTPSPSSARVASPRAVRPESPTPISSQQRVSLRQSSAGQGSPRIQQNRDNEVRNETQPLSPPWSRGVKITRHGAVGEQGSADTGEKFN